MTESNKPSEDEESKDNSAVNEATILNMLREMEIDPDSLSKEELEELIKEYSAMDDFSEEEQNLSEAFEEELDAEELDTEELDAEELDTEELDAEESHDLEKPLAIPPEVMAMLEETNTSIEDLSQEELAELIETYTQIEDEPLEDLLTEEEQEALEFNEEMEEFDELEAMVQAELEGGSQPKVKPKKTVNLLEAELLKSLEKEDKEEEDDLEAKIDKALKEKKEEKKKKVMTEEKFMKYLKERRNKIIYFALWELAFNIEDHAATKQGLYEMLKEVTSKDPIDPLPEHMFYFGLSFILRLKLYERNVITFKKGKLALNINVKNLQKMLKETGEPISERPVITKDEKEKMILDFFDDDFDDL